MPLAANQQNVLCTFHHCSLRCWDSLEGYEMLWLYPPCFQMCGPDLNAYIHTGPFMVHSLNICEWTVQVWVTELNHITCKYMFSLHSRACYFLSSTAFKLSTFYVFTFFLWPLCSLCCTCVTIYFCLEYCSTQPEAEDVLFCAMGIHPSSSGFICIWPVWSFIFTSLKLAFPSLLSGSVPLNGLLGLLYEVQKKAFCGGYVHLWEYWQLNCQIYMKFGIGLYSLWL